MRQRRENRPLDVNILGLLSTNLGDLRGKATLAHELIQNADDAKDEDGHLCATQVRFNVTDDALIVHNDAVFRKIDFDRIRKVASGSKRDEPGDRTTGKFGIGFISVYQVTDSPEIHSAGQIYIFRPDRSVEDVIECWSDPSLTPDKGTEFRLPWAFEASEVRRKLKVRPVTDSYINKLVQNLQGSLPITTLFLRTIERLVLCHNGKLVSSIVRGKVNDGTIQIDLDGQIDNWRVFEGDFSTEAVDLKHNYKESLDPLGDDRVHVAVPTSPIKDGRLFVTLPTGEQTGLPFHINADFYSTSDRKHIHFSDHDDPGSEWNRAAIRAAASVVSSNLSQLRQIYDNDAPAFWAFLSSIHKVYQEKEGDTLMPLGMFWESLLPSLAETSIVYTESSEWLVPDLTRIPTGQKEQSAVQVFEQLGIKIVNRDLWTYRNLLTRREVGVRTISTNDIFNSLDTTGYVKCQPVAFLPVTDNYLSQLWDGIEGVLAKLTGRARKDAEAQMRQCALAPGFDGYFWLCNSAYRSDRGTRALFAPLMSADKTFLTEEGVTLLELLCPEFTPEDAIRTLEAKARDELAEHWKSGTYDPRAVLGWFDEHKSDLNDDQSRRLAQLSLVPGIDGRLWPCRSAYRSDKDTRALFTPLIAPDKTFLVENTVPLLKRLCPRFKVEDAIHTLESITPTEMTEHWEAQTYDHVAVLRWCEQRKSALTKALSNRLAKLALVPGADGRRWPCRSTYRADRQTIETFTHLLPTHETFLSEMNLPLVDSLCPDFTATDALEKLSSQSDRSLDFDWHKGTFNPLAILEWFESHRSSLTTDDHTTLRNIPIVPSGNGLRPLNSLWLPGDFSDPLGLAESVDTLNMGDRIREFLKRDLSTGTLSLKEYVKHHVPSAFSEPQTSDEQRRTLLELLGRRIGVLKPDTEIRDSLTSVRIVECFDGVFRTPTQVYFRLDDVANVLGDSVSYAKVDTDPSLRCDLYTWLGVRSRPHLADILTAIDRAVTTQPTAEVRSTLRTLLEALCHSWKFSNEVKQTSTYLKGARWLPMEGNQTTWFKPSDLYLKKNKELFASKGRFLDIPGRISQHCRELLLWLGVRVDPHPADVVDHLLWLSDHTCQPSPKIYNYLSRIELTSRLVNKLKGAACIWVSDKYYLPTHVFWNNPQLGQFRVQHGQTSEKQRKLLEALGVRKDPDFNDAIDILKKIDTEAEGHVAGSEDRRIINHCWIMLSEAIADDTCSRPYVSQELANTRCVPNDNNILYKPSRVFFEDRPDLVKKFEDHIGQHTIERPVKAWEAMESAGILRLSEVVRGYLPKDIPYQRDELLRQRVTSRWVLIRAILEGASPTNERDVSQSDQVSEFRRTSALMVGWKLSCFDHRLKQDRAPAPEQAFWDRENEIIYFENHGSDLYPWSAIARELALSFGLTSVAPGLKIVLESSTCDNAKEELVQLGIPLINILDDVPVESVVGGQLGGVGDTDVTQTSHSSDVDQNESPSPSSEAPGQRGQEHDANPEGRNTLVSRSARVDVAVGTQGDTVPFASLLFGTDLPSVPDTGDLLVILPSGGPRTTESVRTHTKYSRQTGRSGSHHEKVVKRWKPTEASKELGDRFKDMMLADYGKRCQVCGTTFQMHNEKLQTYVVHVVRPSDDHRTNHLGNLMALCGQHFALIRYGIWRWQDPAAREVCESTGRSEAWERWRDLVLNAKGTAAEKVDGDGNPFIALPVRFSNVYEGWSSEPDYVDEEVRYCLPHWEYLCALLKE